jgi:toxin ParE1/3/4
VKIDWTLLASERMIALHDYIAESSLNAANSQVEIVLSAVDTLIDFPARGRPGRRRGTRELVISGTPYIVAYRVPESTIVILAVIHGARRWPRKFTE